MRIIAGAKKGNVIRPPANLPIRPTTDFCKESLFNILDNQVYFDRITALDLFSGSGAIAFELASRGCADVTAVEQNPKCVAFIKKESKTLELDFIKVTKTDALRFLSGTIKQYDLIFADPPYKYNHHKTLVELVFERKLLAENGLLIIEHAEQLDLSSIDNFDEKRKYGQSILSFFKQKITN